MFLHHFKFVDLNRFCCIFCFVIDHYDYLALLFRLCFVDYTQCTVIGLAFNFYFYDLRFTIFYFLAKNKKWKKLC